MSAAGVTKKRKAVTKDTNLNTAVNSVDELEFGQLDVSSDGSDESEDVYDSASDVVSIEESEESEGEDGSGGKVTEKVRATFQAPTERLDEVRPLGEKNDESDEEPDFKIEKDANGNDRYVYPEIDPDDDSELDELGPEENTIGNIPLSYYDHFPHIGYNINGKKISRPATGAALDALLDSIEVPKGWTGLTDPSTGKPLELTQEELKLLKRVQMNEIADEAYDPYEPMVEYFSGIVEHMPLSAAPEPKRRFVPSKHEAKRVMKIVRAIREGRILPYKPPEENTDESDIQKYDVWANEQPREDHVMHYPAPKLPPPGFEESYHPPPEYLPDDNEKKAWEEADDEDREKEFLPKDHASLRKVPGYEKFVKEKFERCLDLYLAPRVRRTKLNIDPESLLPKLPSPEELKPFPAICAVLFRGHEGRVRSVSVDPTGTFLASGGDDGTARVWQLSTGRQLWSSKVGGDDAVNAVQWRPTKEAFILAIAAGDTVHLAVPPICNPELEASSVELVDAGWGFSSSSSSTQKSPILWSRPHSGLAESGIVAAIPLGHTPKSLSFHRRGDYFVTVCSSPSTPAAAAIAIHTLSKHLTQFPFRKRLKGGGPPQTAHFHPSKPHLFVANQRRIRVYDLSRQTLMKILLPGARWLSSFDIHPTSSAATGSDNLIAGSYDRRLLWHDLDLSPRPYKTLRYHDKAIRAVKFHPSGSYPLFADASDDGSVQVFHGEVVGDMMSNARIVPLKVLKGHKVLGNLGVLDIDWHPTEAWIVSAGGDGTCRLWR